MEPQPKVQKLDHHDVKVVQVASQALRVKKLAPEAILPSRGSALAAGYDLSRFVLSLHRLLGFHRCAFP